MCVLSLSLLSLSFLLSPLRVELLVLLSHILKQRRRLELLSILISQSQQSVTVSSGAKLVDHTEGSTLEGGEAHSEDSAHISLQRRRDDLVLQTMNSFVHELAQNSILDVGLVGGRRGRGLRSEHSLYLRVEGL